MPAFRPMTSAEAATIRRDVPRLGARRVAEHLSEAARAEGRRTVTHAWVTKRAHALDVACLSHGDSARQRARQGAPVRPSYTEAGRLHMALGSVPAVAERLGLKYPTAAYRVRRYYAAIGIVGWQPSGPKPGTPRRTASLS